MDRHGFRQVTPRRSGHVEELPFIDFSSGYVQRSIDQFPRQGSKAPWRLYQNYFLDLFSLRFGRLNDGVLEFGGG
jgi:monooxygenase